MQNLKYRPEIDGLRALAVVSVVLFHYFPALLPGGFLGVDIFFVISGYVITNVLLESSRHQWSLLSFYGNRLRRIVPALSIVLACAWLIGWGVLFPRDFRAFGGQLTASAFFFPNVHLAAETGYFEPSALKRPLLHIWSLGVEEQFYLVWPIALYAILRFKRQRYGVLLLSFLLLTSLTLNVQASLAGNPRGFYLAHDRAWELLSGAILVFREDAAGQERHKGHKQLQLLLGLSLLISAMCFDHGTTELAPLWALLAMTGTIVILGIHGQQLVGSALIDRRVVLLGRFSYPLYLWHWPVLCYATIALGGVTLLQRMGLLVLSLVLGLSTYLFVELPIRRRWDQSKDRRGIVVACLIGLLALGGLGLATVEHEGFPDRYPAAMSQLRSPATSELESVWRVRRCLLEETQRFSEFASECVDQSPPTSPVVVLWGDSMAAQLYPGLRAVQQHASFRIAQFTSQACPPMLGIDYHVVPHCHETNEAVLGLVRSLKPALVILAGDWLFDRPPDARFSQLDSTLRELKRSGIHVVLVGSGPQWTRDPIDIWYGDPSSSARSEFPTFTNYGLRPESRAMDVAMRAKALAFGVDFFSPYDALCNAGGCRLLGGEGRSYFLQSDYRHLTVAGSEEVAVALSHAEPALRPIGSGSE